MNSSHLWDLGEGKGEKNPLQSIVEKLHNCHLIEGIQDFEFFYEKGLNSPLHNSTIYGRPLLGTTIFFESTQPIFELAGHELRVFLV